MSCLKKEVDVFGFRTSIVLILTSLVAGLFLPLSDALGQGRNEVFAITGQAAPDGNGAYSSFWNPLLNNSGQVAFWARLTGTSGGANDNMGIFRGNGWGLTQMARTGQAAPDGNGIFSSLSTPTLNQSGEVAFWAEMIDTSGGTADDRGIFRASDGAMVQIVRRGQVAPDGNGTFNSPNNQPALNNLGQVAFFGSISNASGNASTGTFTGSGGFITQVVRRNQSTPDGNGTFSGFDRPVLNNFGLVAFGATGSNNGAEGVFVGSGGSLTPIYFRGQVAPDGNGSFGNTTHLYDVNDSGQVAFRARLTGTSDGTNDDRGIFVGSDGERTQIVRRGELTPDGNGTFRDFTYMRINGSGQVAFRSTLIDTSGGNTDDSGIFRGSGGEITQIARAGQSAPGGNGIFASFNHPLLNDSGQAAFQADLTGTNDDSGIFSGDGIDLLQVVRKGDSLASGIVTNVYLGDMGMTNSGPFNRVSNGRDSLNERGQIAYRAELADGNQVVGLWTPDLYWRSWSSGAWDSASHWTLGLQPGHVHDVYIAPADNLTVAGPSTDTTVRNLQVGGGNGMATLALQEGVSLFVNGGIVTVESNGMLSGSGTIVGDVHALGVISPGTSAGTIAIDGNVLLGSSAATVIELGGLGSGQFDRLVVTANLHLNGDLFVSLIDGHSLGMNQHYLIAEVGGELFGQFNTLDEGALVGNFAGHDLFISYAGGSGNSVVLFTAIPEPNASMFLAIAAIALLHLRCRRRGSAGYLA